MKETEVYGFPYPECSPPLVKDSSQIVQMASLALAIDTEVQRVVDEANLELITPPNARATIAVLPVATTDSLVTPAFDLSVFQAGGAAIDTGAGGLRVQDAGWYFVGCHALVTSATAAVLPAVRLTVNGAPASSWSAVGGNYIALNSRLAALSGVPLVLAANDVIRMEIRHTAAGSPAWDYRPHIWCVRMVNV